MPNSLSAWWLVSILALLGACFLCAGAAFAYARAVRRVHLDLKNALRQAKDSFAVLAEHAEDLDQLKASLKKLHSRAGMRELRERQGNGHDSSRAPDYRKDPQGWLEWQQSEINKQRAR